MKPAARDTTVSHLVSPLVQPQLWVNVQRTISPDSFDMRSATQEVYKEWQFDSQGKDRFGFPLFVNCLFQIADTWARAISANAYVKVLESLLDRATTTDEESGRRFWVWDLNGDNGGWFQKRDQLRQKLEASKSSRYAPPHACLKKMPCS